MTICPFIKWFSIISFISLIVSRTNLVCILYGILFILSLILIINVDFICNIIIIIINKTFTFLGWWEYLIFQLIDLNNLSFISILTD